MLLVDLLEFEKFVLVIDRQQKLLVDLITQLLSIKNYTTNCRGCIPRPVNPTVACVIKGVPTLDVADTPVGTTVQLISNVKLPTLDVELILLLLNKFFWYSC
jgi:hypothetical protein